MLRLSWTPRPWKLQCSPYKRQVNYNVTNSNLKKKNCSNHKGTYFSANMVLMVLNSLIIFSIINYSYLCHSSEKHSLQVSSNSSHSFQSDHINAKNSLIIHNIIIISEEGISIPTNSIAVFLVTSGTFPISFITRTLGNVTKLRPCSFGTFEKKTIIQ